jgi:hypothetical protein
MSYDMYQVPEPPSAAGDVQKPARSNRRGQNLSLADRARGGQNSARQQRRDGGGRFAGSTKRADQGTNGAGSTNGSSNEKQPAWR